ncbi:MAG TPA: hypothetical protein VLB50_05070 [Ignavibacteriaceae bacterium]|nr:hypothetical protein [Ignavibacteriaceae bacterium]
MNKIKIKGVNYDVGMSLIPPRTFNEPNASEITESMRIIKNELHCNAVRIYGRNLEKLIECSHIAINEGLMVWLSPRNVTASSEETLEYIIQCSMAAEQLRKISPDIVYILGNEFSLDVKGFIEGETIYDRILTLSNPFFIIKNSFSSVLHNALNSYLEKAVFVARRHFKGEITYASGEWEKINWELFDIIGLNYYRNIFNGWKYRRTIRKYSGKIKKLAVTEFGCCSYKGADKKGAWGYSIVDYRASRPHLKKIYKRDESVQSDYLIDLLKIYSSENVYAAFIYTFIARKSVYDVNPEYDLDMANFGLIKVLPPGIKDPDAPYLWERKKSFSEVSKFFGEN